MPYFVRKARAQRSDHRNQGGPISRRNFNHSAQAGESNQDENRQAAGKKVFARAQVLFGLRRQRAKNVQHRCGRRRIMLCGVQFSFGCKFHGEYGPNGPSTHNHRVNNALLA